MRRPLRGYHAVFQLSSPSTSKGEQGTKPIDFFFINEGNFRDDEGYYITRPTLSGEFLFPDQLPCLFWIAQIYLLPCRSAPLMMCGPKTARLRSTIFKMFITSTKLLRNTSAVKNCAITVLLWSSRGGSRQIGPLADLAAN